MIRAEPWNRHPILWDLAWLQRRWRRDHRWRIDVRLFREDPFGAVVHQDFVANRGAVDSAVSRIEQTIAAGAPPFPESG